MSGSIDPAHPNPQASDLATEVEDVNSGPYQSATLITPGTPLPPGRAFGFVCTTAGTVTLTLSEGGTITLPIQAQAALQTLPFAVTNLVLGTAVGSFWNLN